ncbi:MAG TPA: TonB-dependent receptor [Gemmatimonadaceae bacterium]|jgi:TonB-linked SusC/RagA family outer membrane protein|nr:TonB-dependent receptor [Gemmatimonadaceae bacterium]
MKRRLWSALLVAAGCLLTSLTPSRAQAQAMGAIRGTVVDSASRRPVDGVQVVLAGTTLGALTSSGGTYVIRNVPVGTYSVRATRLGFGPAQRSVTVAALDTSVADFTLRAAALNLSQVVVVGYGTANRREVTNAVTTVRSEDLVNVPVASVEAALQGKAAGLQVIQNAGNPGNGISVRVRGSSSLSAGNQPLYVIDGIPMLRDSYSQLGMGGQDVSAVSGISPDEIASIDVLKDASASAIYGSRGSNGVVLITTKRGQAGRPKITWNGYYGTQDLSKKVNMLNAKEYVAYFNEAAKNDGYADDELPFAPGVDDTINTDWQESVLQTAPVYDLSLGMTGGSDRISYFVSGSFFNQKGILVGSQYRRANVRANLDFSPSSKLSVRTSIGLGREGNFRNENDNTIDGVATNALANQPNVRVRNSDGTFTSTDDGLEYTNPVALGVLDNAESRTLRAMGNSELSYAFSDRLRLNGRVGVDMLNLRDLRWNSPLIIGTYAASARGVAQQGNTTVSRYVAETYLQWDAPGQRFGQLSLVGGSGVEYNSRENDFLQGEGFGSSQFRYPGNAGKVTSYDGGRTDNNLASFFSRGTWSLKDRYFASASVRMDGSSRFGDNNRYGLFSSGSIGWALSDEAWLSAIKKVGDLKLRLSYGETGNQGIADDYAPLARFGRANYSDAPGIAPSSLANPDLKWETTREFDVGVDFSMLSGRVGVVADYFRKKTDDLLVSRPITSTSGFTSVYDNIGNIENRGWEFQLSTEPIRESKVGGLSWSSDFNISFLKNEVTALYRNEPFNAGIRSLNRVEIGQPLGAFHTLRFKGVDPQTGDAIYDDVNGDGDITADDRVIVGSPHPDYFGGFTNTISWKGFDFRSFVQFTQGNKVFNAIRIFADDGGYYFDNKLRDSYEKRWKKPGDIAEQPRLSYDGTSGARDVSSRFVEDGSYVRLQELTLGYRLPRSWARTFNLDEARFFVSGRNLVTWTDYTGYNPDVNSNGSSATISLGTDFYAYPLARTFSFGVRGAW